MSLNASARSLTWPDLTAAAFAAARGHWIARAGNLHPTADDDAALVTQHLAGDPQAFAELVRRYTGAVYNVTYRYTANVQEAENLTQETFLRAWSALPRVTLDRPLKPYLLKIAVNLCHDWADKNRLLRVEPLEDGEGEPVSDAGDPLHAVSARELGDAVTAKLQELVPLQRTVIALRYTEGLSYDEMAVVLGLPVNTVRTQLHRAKGRLRELLAAERESE